MAEPLQTPTTGLVAAGDIPPTPPADPVAADQPAAAPAEGPHPPPAGAPDTSAAAPEAAHNEPPAEPAPKPPSKRQTKTKKPTQTVVDLVPADVTPWIEASEVSLLLDSMRLDVTEEEGQIRGVGEAGAEQAYRNLVLNPPTSLLKMTVWRTSEDGMLASVFYANA